LLVSAAQSPANAMSSVLAATRPAAAFLALLALDGRRRLSPGGAVALTEVRLALVERMRLQRGRLSRGGHLARQRRRQLADAALSRAVGAGLAAGGYALPRSGSVSGSSTPRTRAGTPAAATPTHRAEGGAASAQLQLSMSTAAAPGAWWAAVDAASRQRQAHAWLCAAGADADDFPAVAQLIEAAVGGG